MLSIDLTGKRALVAGVAAVVLRRPAVPLVAEVPLVDALDAVLALGVVAGADVAGAERGGFVAAVNAVSAVAELK